MAFNHWQEWVDGCFGEYCDFHDHNLYTQNHWGLSNYDDYSYDSPMNAMDSSPYFQPQYQPHTTEADSSLEDMINAFVRESQASSSGNEGRLDDFDMKMRNLNASIKSLEHQVGQLVESVNNPPKDVFMSSIDDSDTGEDYTAIAEFTQPHLEHCHDEFSDLQIVVTDVVVEHVCTNEMLSKEEVDISSCSFVGIAANKELLFHNQEEKCYDLRVMESATGKEYGLWVDVMEEAEGEFLFDKLRDHQWYRCRWSPIEKFETPIPTIKEPEHRKAKLKGER